MLCCAAPLACPPPPPHARPTLHPRARTQTLSGINPDVALESYTMNITTLEGFDAFKVRPACLA